MLNKKTISLIALIIGISLFMFGRANVSDPNLVNEVADKPSWRIRGLTENCPAESDPLNELRTAKANNIVSWLSADCKKADQITYYAYDAQIVGIILAVAGAGGLLIRRRF